MRVAEVNDTGNSLTVVGEIQAVTETDPTFNGFTSNTDFVSTGVIKISLQELQDSYFDLDEWVRNAFGKRYWRGVSSMITNGSSTGNVQSLITGLTTFTSPNTAGITYTDLTGIYAQLDPAYISNASWTFNSTTRGLLMNVTDNYGHPLLTSPILGGLDYILGRPVVINQFLPNVAHLAHGSVVFGDFSAGYTFRPVGDLNILRLNERYADTFEVGFIGYSRIGGYQTDAGTHPLLALVQS